jgi:hypothetical protein
MQANLSVVAGCSLEAPAATSGPYRRKIDAATDATCRRAGRLAVANGRGPENLFVWHDGGPSRTVRL